MNRKKAIQEQIAALEKSKEYASDKCDFRTFSQLCQDIRILERELNQLKYDEYAKEDLIRLNSEL